MKKILWPKRKINTKVKTFNGHVAVIKPFENGVHTSGKAIIGFDSTEDQIVLPPGITRLFSKGIGNRKKITLPSLDQ